MLIFWNLIGFIPLILRSCMPPRNLNSTYEVKLPWVNSFIRVRKENLWPAPIQGLVFYRLSISESILHQSALKQDAACPSLITSSSLSCHHPFSSIHFYHAGLWDNSKPKESEGPTGGLNHTSAPHCVVHIEQRRYFLLLWRLHVYSMSDLVELHPELLRFSDGDDSAGARRHTQILAWVLLITGWTRMWRPLLSVLSSNLNDLLQMEGAFIFDNTEVAS